MNHIISVLGCLSVVLVCSLCGTAQETIPSQGMYAVISSESMVFHLGDISVEGTMYGLYNEAFLDGFQDIADNPLVSVYISPDFIENLHLNPFLGVTEIDDIAEITIVPKEILTLSSLEDILPLMDDIITYSDVSLSFSEGMYLVGTDGSSLDYSLSETSGVSGFVSFPFEGFDELYSFVCLSADPSLAEFSYEGNNVLVYPFSDGGTIQLSSSTGDVIWSETLGQSILLLEDDDFALSDFSAIHIIPFDELDQDAYLDVEFNPSDQNPDINELLQTIQDMETGFDLNSIPMLSDTNQSDSLLQSLSSFLNGGIVIVDHTGSVLVDGTDQQLSKFGFTRVNEATIHGSSGEVIVTADYTMIFFGDHFYSSLASNSEQGVAVPLIPILLWAGLILCIVVLYVINKKSLLNNQERHYNIDDKKVYYLSIMIHIIGYICAFFLIDYAVSYQIGISMLTELSLNGATMIAGALFIVQCLLWVIGFIFASLPLGIIIGRVLSLFGFDKTYKHFAKGVTALSIWPITVLYLTMFLNIVLLFFNPFEAMI